MTTPIPLESYYDSIHARLGAILGATHAHLGEPSAVMDKDGRAHPYAALYPSPGWQHGVSLGGDVDQIALTFQVTAAGGDTARALRAIDRVREALTGFTPSSPGLCCGHLAEVDSYDPGPLRIGRDVQPARYYAPLLWTGLIWLPEGGTP